MAVLAKAHYWCKVVVFLGTFGPSGQLELSSHCRECTLEVLDDNNSGDNSRLTAKCVVGFSRFSWHWELKSGTLTKNSKSAITDAVRFLRLVLDAHRRVKARQVSPGALEGSLAYRETIRAIDRLPDLKSHNEATLQVIQGLAQIAEQARTTGGNNPAIDRLQEFFRMVRETSLSEDRRPVESLSMPK